MGSVAYLQIILCRLENGEILSMNILHEFRRFSFLTCTHCTRLIALFFQQTEGFKGCIRQLALRQRIYDLTLRQKTSQKVGQCNAHVEQGTFFGGDAYATYGT